MKDKIFELIKKEEKRQQETLMMIPSENYASAAVREALGSFLTHKYAEGYPGRRYYQGNKIIDEIEDLAVERAKKLFGVTHANVQPYSGSPANMAVYFTLANPGDTIMGMDLRAGGHLTHGAPVSFSGKFFKVVSYGVDKKGWLDYKEIENLAKKHRPKLIWCGATAYPRFFDWKKFTEIAEKIDAWLVADIAHYAGLIAGGAYLSPVPFVDVVTTTTHKTLRGPRGAIIMVTQRGLKKDPQLGQKIDRWVFPGIQGGPHENNIAGIAVALGEATKPSFRKYARQVVKNAKTLARELKKYDFNLVTGGTDNHLILIDLRNKGIGGKEAAVILEEAGIVVNANSIPNDPSPPLKPSGIRLGTPALTTRGMKEKEMKLIASWIHQILNLKFKKEKVGKEVRDLCKKFPIR
jgi:glycine hydroxymethyltransferase